MRILQISSALDERFGGPPNVVSNLQRQFENYNPLNSLLVFGQGRSSSLDSYENCELKYSKVTYFRRKRSSQYGKLLNLAELRIFIAQFKKCDIVITHQVYNFQNIYVYFFSKILRKPYVMIPHGTLTDRIRKVNYAKKFIPDWLIFSRIILNAIQIGVASRMEFDQLPPAFKSKGTIFGMGIPKLSTEVGKISGVAPTKVFLFLGRITEVKGLRNTVRAFEVLRKIHPDITLKIAGDGDANFISGLKLLVTKLGIGNFVEFHGWANSKDKEKLFKECDYLILNSESENFAMVVAEAQLRGLPVLVTRNVGIAEIVAEVNSGVVIENSEVDKIVSGVNELITNDYLSMSKNGREKMRDLAWENVASYWINSIEKSITKR